MKLFLAGLGAGAALGVLLAPRSGNETRDQLRERGRVLANRLKQRTSRLRRDLQKQAGQIQQQAADLTANAGSHLKAAVQTVASKAGLGPLAKLNIATREELMSVNGIGPVLADRIIASRPFTSSEQVLEQGLLPEPTFRELVRVFEAA
jgi:DNA uptake protein ComE-like DNA-binding protein